MPKGKGALYPLVGMNAERAEWARDALAVFGQRTGVDCEDVETQISDLVCDLKHLACAESVDWATVEQRVEMHYEAENGCHCKKCGRRFDVESDADSEEDLCVECVS